MTIRAIAERLRVDTEWVIGAPTAHCPAGWDDERLRQHMIGIIAKHPQKETK
jgi:hypothetical protein